MNAEIIAVGTELLLGQIANTNAQYISSELAEIGVNVYHHTVVGDNPNRLEKAIAQAEKRANLIIFTGGLGPTKDDLTKETIARHIGTELEMDELALQTIIDYFNKTNRIMTENNKKQALVLKDAKVLPNEFGMAPGMFMEANDCYYMLLPGPPHEMRPMFHRYGREAIMEKMGETECIESLVLRFFGIGEAQLDEELADLLDRQTNPTIAPLAADGEVTIRITARDKDVTIARKMIKEMEQKINRRVGQYFYGYDDTSVMKELLKELQAKDLTIAAAESLTAGLFQSEMASISGASASLLGGVVCYSNEAKMKYCHVKKETLEQYGAVSEQCARELAENVRKELVSDIGISFTGVAGPDSLERNPAGTVWIGIARENQPTKTFLLTVAGSRNGVRHRAVRYGCSYLIQMMREN